MKWIRLSNTYESMLGRHPRRLPSWAPSGELQALDGAFTLVSACILANEPKCVTSAMRTGTSGNQATCCYPPLGACPHYDRCPNAMGKEKSPAIWGGHWGGGPPENPARYRLLCATAVYRDLLPSSSWTA